MTNYERIKNMSIEEMTEWMYVHTNCFECETEGSGLHCNEFSQCKDVMRKYLDSEFRG